MTRPTERYGDHDGVREHRAYRVMRGLLPALLVFLLVPVILVLKVPTATTGTVPCDCQTCHVDPHAGGFAGCTSCHAYPPATGSHRVHFDNNAPLVDGLRYDDTTARSTADAYIFGCGNCHPLDSAKHMNGTVDVELYNASAPAESLKAKNPANAAYDNLTKTCGNVYCHSGYTVTSGPVGLPLQSPPNPVPPGYSLWNGTYILDPTGNLTYDPYTVTKTKNYRVTPAWGTTGTFTTCVECHGFPTTTSVPQVQAMVGDTHGWLDDYNYYDGHMYNMGFGGVPCATCHNTSVNHYGNYPTDPPGVWGPRDIYIYNAVTIKNRSLHVNGSSNVAFDTINGYRYYSPWSGTNELKDLTAATYDAPTKTCGNVSCHINQTTVKWGSPYRYWNSAECNICHSM
jgi:predicted CxxxxCH...CXXCH cytochrome family protein